MSNNCVRCVKNPRNGNNPTSLLCLECESKEWDEQCRKALARYPAFATFIDTYARGSGTSRDIFTGQTLRMVADILKQEADADDSLASFNFKTISDLMHALVDNIEEDLLLALRFAYYVRAKPLVHDPLYDEAEKEYINRPEVDDTPLMQPGSDKEEDYPCRVRALCLYLNLAREDQAGQKPRNAAISAKSSPVKAVAKAETAKAAPEAPTGSLF